MKHEKYGAKMDADFKGVKVFYEKPAEVVGNSLIFIVLFIFDNTKPF